MKILTKATIYSLIILISLNYNFLIPPPVTKAQNTSSNENIDPTNDIADEDVQQEEDNSLSGLFNKIGDNIASIDEINAQDKAKLILNEKDIEAIRDKKVDERVLRNLIYAVTPVEQGGAGFKRLRIKRLIKGYSTDPNALTKESEYPNESDKNISAHYSGQGMDLSEIDEIEMKKVTKKKALGVTYSSKTQSL